MVTWAECSVFRQSRVAARFRLGSSVQPEGAPYSLITEYTFDPTRDPGYT